MSNFPIVATVLAMILGLSVTRLLMGALTVFRIRRVAAPDWVALVWAVMLFTSQLDFWWAVNALPTIKATFSFAEFLLLVLLALSLFVSAALLLPSRSEDEQSGLRVYFEQDGRYALLSFSTYLVLGLIVNVLFFQVSPMALWGGAGCRHDYSPGLRIQGQIAQNVFDDHPDLCAHFCPGRRHYTDQLGGSWKVARVAATLEGE